MIACGCAVCSPAADGIVQPTPSATMAARHGTPASNRLTASRSHTGPSTSTGYTIRAMKHYLIATLTATAAATLLGPTLFGQPAGQATVPPVTANRLANAQNEPDNWLMMNGD